MMEYGSGGGTAQVEGCSGARLLCRAEMLGAEGDLSRGRRLGLG